MPKLNFVLPSEMLEWLRVEAQALGINVSELVRRILDEKRLGRLAPPTPSRRK